MCIVVSDLDSFHIINRKKDRRFQWNVFYISVLRISHIEFKLESLVTGFKWMILSYIYEICIYICFVKRSFRNIRHCDEKFLALLYCSSPIRHVKLFFQLKTLHAMFEEHKTEFRLLSLLRTTLGQSNWNITKTIDDRKMKLMFFLNSF